MRGKRLEAGESYAGRRASAEVMNFTLDRDVAALIREYSASKRVGAFITKLVCRYHEEQIERVRAQKEATLSEPTS